MYDVVIVGSGIVGLVQALLLSKESGLRLALVDEKESESVWSERQYDSRVYAITPASRVVFEKIQIWPELEAKRLSVFKHMRVWDGQRGGELIFDHAQLNVPALGYIVEDKLIRSALMEKVKEDPQIDLLCPLTLTEIREKEEFLELIHSSPLSQEERARDEGLNNKLCCKLLIGADGAQSWVRERAGFSLQIQDYQHTALIAQVEIEEKHQQTAWQVFLSDPAFFRGILAFLPLEDSHQCSIVWSTTPDEAKELLNLDEQHFQEVLAKAYSLRLGKVKAVSKRQIFPLYERHAEHYVKRHIALIGDAAHTIHPLAGLGLNLGIADAALLAELIVGALIKGRDFASQANLRPYERARKTDNLLMLAAVKGLKYLFSSQNRGLGLLRSQGLNLSNRLPWLKQFFAAYAGVNRAH